MILHNFKYEWIQLMRDRWVVSLLILFIVLCLFSGFNGKMKADKRQEEVTRSIELMKESDTRSVALIDSLERGLVKGVSPWLNPQRLGFVANRAPRVAAMQPSTLALISTGQSDLYSHAVKPTLSSDSYLLGFTELSNPVQLLFGSFDLAFVCTYLLPLLVLGFSYNLLSAEKEQGSLRLTISQPISLYQWLFTKMLLRFTVMTIIVWASILITLALSGISLFNERGIAKFLLIVTIYIFFWFIIALIVNAFGKSSGANAIAIISIWVAFVLLVPAVISQTANTIYPVPSRINMIHEMRVANANAAKESDKILKGFFKDHPELAPQDTGVQNMYEYYLRFFASQDVVRNEVHPIIQEFEHKLKAQQSWVESFRFISPSLLLQSAFNDMAGTSSRQYESYRSQVISFAEQWRGYFLPRMFKNETMKQQDFASLPAFTFDYGRVQSTFLSDVMGIVTFSLIGLIVSALAYRRYAKEVLFS